MESGSPNDESTTDCYPMNKKKLGNVYIFNHIMFDDKTLGSRHGSLRDCIYIEETFRNLKFEVVIYNDFTYKNILKTLSNISKIDFATVACLVIFVLTYGSKGKLFARDTEYYPEVYWKKFDGTSSLKHKPKLIFIQVTDGDVHSDDSVPTTFSIPFTPDVLLMYSTYDEVYAWSSTVTGSSFIQCLCKELKLRAENSDLLTLLTFLNQTMLTYFIRMPNQMYSVLFHSSVYICHRMSYYEKEQARLLRLLAEYEAEEEDGGELLSSEESDADENVSEQDVQCDMDIEEEVEQSSDVEPEEEPDGHRNSSLFGHLAKDCRRRVKTYVVQKNVCTINEKYFFDCWVNGKPLQAYVESGCGAVLITKSSVDLLGLETIPCTEFIMGCGGSSIETLDKVKLNLKVDSAEAEVEALVVPNVTQNIPVLVGQTFLNNNEVGWRQSTHTIRKQFGQFDSLEDCYLMNKEKFGKVYIFNHITFDNKSLESRYGTIKDCRDLEETFHNLRFDVIIYNDFTHRKILEVLPNIEIDNSNSDCLVIFVLTYGSKGKIFARDIDYYPDVFWQTFDGSLSLMYKPNVGQFDPLKDCYPMNQKKLGKVYIFNHITFDNVSFGARYGTIKDCRDIQETFHNLKFEVVIYNDFTYRKILAVLSNIANVDNSNIDCLVIFVLTHGSKGKIFARDIDYYPDVFWKKFDGNLSLMCKPKLIFIQTSRGDEPDDGIRTTDDVLVPTYSIPQVPDVLLMYSSYDEFHTWSSSVAGSPFVQCFCKELKLRAENADLLTILTFLNGTMLSHFIRRPKEIYSGNRQIGTIVSTLTKVLYFVNVNK
ncbi:hypothetical protein RN001_014528 [Aquatica leii]|uniref:Caspase family p20 domain-containing protein n=1 Tax=Aquatica leii TaxID=1421715 RepID=A0AAN7NY55_9COLE|nr:hypothetical protein RN001_014528 [Aquatica leii]